MEMVRRIDLMAEVSEPARARVSHDGHGHWAVHLEGRLPVDCVGALARGLADTGIDIVRGCARRVDRRRWEIDLEVAPRRPGLDPAAVDYVALAARRSNPHAATPIVVDVHEIVRDASQRGLVVSVRGMDRVGFLASLLERFAGILLFPVEMFIETIQPEGDGVIQLGSGAAIAVDTFVLRSLGDRTPPPDAEVMLSGLLQRLRGV